MRNNNLNKVENTLRSIAKRYKTVKYSLGLAILFLMMGVSAFSEEVVSQNAVSKESIQNSIGSLQSKIDAAKKENEKELAGLKLELVQLMEQGEQVVKLPWASWVYGMNYTYNSWNSKYKGHGDRKENSILVRESSQGRFFDESTSSLGSSGLGNSYGTTDLEIVEEPSSEIEVSAGIRPKSVNKQAPDLQLPTVAAQNAPQVNISMAAPQGVLAPNVVAPSIRQFNIEVNAVPFNDFTFTTVLENQRTYGTVSTTSYIFNPSIIAGSTDDLSGLGRGVFWGGYNPYTGQFVNTSGRGRVAVPVGNRVGALIYINNDINVARDAAIVRNASVYVAGNVDGAGPVQGSHQGLIGIHTVRNVILENIDGHLYGKGNFISIETWHGGKVDLRNVSVKIEKPSNSTDNNQNVIFYIYPALYEASTYGDNTPTTRGLFAFYQRGSFSGTVDADLTSQKNTVYSVMGASGSFNIDSRGTYKLEGADNIVYSGIGYSPNYQNLVDKNSSLTGIKDFYNTGMTPSIKLTKAPESYGDNNTILFFSDKLADSSTRTGGNIQVWEPERKNVASGSGAIGNDSYQKWDLSTVGIYQGEILAKGIIGEYKSIDKAATQTEAGNLGTSSDSSSWVENNVGILARSGQRVGIDPDTDLGANTNYTNGNDFKTHDPIHSLQVNDIDISFGKYSRNGIMLASEKGTVLDVAKSTNNHEANDKENSTVPIRTAAITDYDLLADKPTANSISYNDSINKAGTGTIIAYSDGVWDSAKNSGMSAATKASLGDGNHSSEINIGTGVTLTGRYKRFGTTESYPIAYVAKNKGVITVEGDTEAKGYKTVLAYASDNASIKTGKYDSTNKYVSGGGLKAVDEWVSKDNETKSYLYQNIGAYSKGSSIVIGGNAVINGLAAFAEGTGGRVSLNGTANVINTGSEGGLFAKDGGIVEFGGGTITNKDNSAVRGLTTNDHTSTTPFYATSNDTKAGTTQGRINFTGDTTLEMYDGILVSGEASDYNATIDPLSTAKYQGTGRVTVQIRKDGVNLGVLRGLTNVTWDGNSSVTSFLNALRAVPKFAAINDNKHSFISGLTEGTLTINGNVNLSDTNDRFNGISMERELVTIAAGKNVTGNGRGLSMGSNSGASSNAESGYINRGNVNITGGTTSKGVAGINVSYGNILNDKQGIVSVNIGAGLYGTNGSKIVNNGIINVTGSGTGIAALSKGSTTYGNNSIEIINDGTLNISGNDSIGIYADNNNNAAQNTVKITNNKALTLSGKNTVGIYLKGNNGGLINLGNSSNIKVGENGIGVYAQNSKITLNNNTTTIETADKGVGIYSVGSTIDSGSKTLEYKYSGSTNGTGIAVLYAGANANNSTTIKLNNSTNTTGGIVGVFANGGGTLTNTASISGTSKSTEFGIVGENTDINNSGNIALGNADTLSKGNVGIYEKTASKTITNNGVVTVGNNSIGLYGYGVTNSGKVTTGDAGIGVFSQGGNVTLSNSLQIGKREAVGVFTTGANQNIISTGNISIGDTSYGFVTKGANTNLTTNNGTVTLGNDAVFAYSDNTGVMTNNTKLVATGSNNYALYSGGIVRNLADIEFGAGIGNVGIYSVRGGTAYNGNNLGSRPKITVSGSDRTNKIYGIGMAAGYVDENTGALRSTGNIENHGTINVLQSGSIGMYAVGNGSTAKNYGDINLSGKATVGMYLDQGAIGENHGNIQTVPNSTNDGIIGVVALNGAVFKNYGNVTINSPNGVGFYGSKADNYEDKGGTLTVSGDDSQDKRYAQANSNNTGKGVKGVRIVVPPSGVGVTTVRDGQTITPTPVDTNIAAPNPTHVTVGSTTLNLANINIPTNIGGASEFGMYVDTSGVNYTNPINGLENLTNLRKVNLAIGSEASLYTSSKDIEIGDNILNPYNTAIERVSSGSGSLKWAVKSANLTWIATVTQNSDFTISKMYLSKIPYTSFAKDSDTFNFMDGLEKRYGVEGVGTREKELYNKLNGIGKGEARLLAQAVDEMKGHQYSNVQQRVNATSQILDKEFSNLRSEWSNLTKDSNKIKTFGTKGEYKSDSAGVVDYKNYAYGVVYINENEDIKLGRGIGWYTGIVHNTFKFKDIGKSKEQMLQGKVGMYKSVPFDDNNSLNWTISGDVFVGYNKMERKFLVVDEIFKAKGNYYSYGLGVKNELSKDFRLSEDISLRPYVSLKLEYGRTSKIKEKNGEMKLEVKEKDYISVKPEVGTELSYRHYFGAKTLRTSIGVAYENELGKVGSVKNKVRVADTTADWYTLRGEKEDRRGNVKFDLNVGFDNQMYGVTANVGYDTKGENVRGGLGLRVVF